MAITEANEAKKKQANEDPTLLLLRNRREQAMLGISQAQQTKQKQRQDTRSEAEDRAQTSQFIPPPNPHPGAPPNQVPTAKRTIFNPLKRVATAPTANPGVETHPAAK